MDVIHKNGMRRDFLSTPLHVHAVPATPGEAKKGTPKRPEGREALSRRAGTIRPWIAPAAGITA